MTIPVRELQRLGKSGEIPADGVIIKYLF